FRGKFETAPGLWARLRGEREKYVLAVQTALADWCTRGDLVYHGLAGQFLLRGLPGVLRVRLIAPLDQRIRAFIEANPKMTRAQAEAFIHDVDQTRSRWVKVIYGEEIMDTSFYDLIINLRTISLDSACHVLTEAVQQPRFQITDEVEAELFAFAAQCRNRLSRVEGG
ncbi:AAA family ATPase, partial [Gemmatimonadota bacterium]